MFKTSLLLHTKKSIFVQIKMNLWFYNFLYTFFEHNAVIKGKLLVILENSRNVNHLIRLRSKYLILCCLEYFLALRSYLRIQ